MKILIADDEPIVRQGLRLIIKNSHIPSSKIFEAASGNEAVKIARKNPPDIALIDIKMPGLNGLEVLKEIRGFLPNLQAIIVSAYDTFEYSRQALRFGASDFLVKPFQADDVVQALCSCMQPNGPLVKEREKEKQSKKGYPAAPGLTPNYDELVDLVCLGNASAVCYKIKELFTGASAIDLTPGFIIQAVEVMMLMHRAAMKKGADQEKSDVICYEAVNKLLNAHAPESIFEILKDSTYEIIALVPQEKASGKEELVSRADKYIHEHLNGELTLQDVAKHVYLSPAYFSTIFKLVKGRNFSEYTNELKIETAKTLLLDDSLSIRYIARRVGFSDTSYFSRVFKNKTGLSPGLYRKKVTG